MDVSNEMGKKQKRLREIIWFIAERTELKNKNKKLVSQIAY